MEKDKMITLKEAAQISNYAPDYIGQLIRSGKIPGKQIYTGITWMTTAEAILNYKKNKNGHSGQVSTASFFKRQQRKILLEVNIIKLFFQTFKSAIPIFIIFTVCLFMLVIYGCYLIFGSQKKSGIKNQASSEKTEQFSY